MSNVFLSEVESQINSYLTHPNTLALAKSSQHSYRIILRKKLLPFCKEKEISKLDETFVEHMEDFIFFLRSEKLAARSIQHYVTVVKFFLRFQGFTITHTYKIPRADKQAFDLKHQKRWFSDIDIAACKTYHFPTQHTRNHVLVKLFCETGARIDEIAHIRRGDVNLEKKTILLGHSKTVPRPVFFSQETAIFIDRLFKEKFPDPAETAFKKIFPGKNRIYKIIIGMLKDLGLKSNGDGRGPHTFRHFVATTLHYTMGMEITHVAALLGDKTGTIIDCYLHPTAEMLHAKMSRAAGWS